MVRFLLPGLLLLLAGSGLAQESKTQITVTGGKEDAKNVPVVVLLDFAANPKAQHARLSDGKETLVGQLTYPGLIREKIAKGENSRELHFILPELKAGATRTFKLE